jgi:hypothetical protein
MLPPGPPLRPSGPEGRRLLREELLHGEYHRHHLLQRVLDWLWRRVEGGVDAASGASLLTTVAAMLIAVGLVVGLAVLLSRVRRDRRRRTRSAVVLAQDRPAATDLRRRAEAALAAGRHAEAVVDGFRALAARQVERGRLADQPGATAREVAVRLAASYPAAGDRVGRTADLFDATLYGDRPAGPEDATGVLALDDALAAVR